MVKTVVKKKPYPNPYGKRTRTESVECQDYGEKKAYSDFTFYPNSTRTSPYRHTFWGGYTFFGRLCGFGLGGCSWLGWRTVPVCTILHYHSKTHSFEPIYECCPGNKRSAMRCYNRMPSKPQPSIEWLQVLAWSLPGWLHTFGRRTEMPLGFAGFIYVSSLVHHRTF